MLLVGWVGIFVSFCLYSWIDLHGDTLMMNFLTRSAGQIIYIAEMKFQNNRRTLSLNRNYIPASYGHVQCCGVWKSIRAASEWYPDPCEQVHILMSCYLKFLLKLSSDLRLGLLYHPNFSTEFRCMYICNLSLRATCHFYSFFHSSVLCVPWRDHVIVS